MVDEKKYVDINDERLWNILFDEACVEGMQAERILKYLENIAIEKQGIIKDTIEHITAKLRDKQQELRDARHKLSIAMFTDEKAYDKARILTQKELSIHDAIEIVKEEGKIYE